LTALHPCAAGSPLVVTSTSAPEMPSIAGGRRQRIAQGHARDASATCPKLLCQVIMELWVWLGFWFSCRVWAVSAV
jgi:hypothetical protein